MAATRKSVSFLERHLKLAEEVNKDLLAEIVKLRAENQRLRALLKNGSICYRVQAWFIKTLSGHKLPTKAQGQ
jgi:hypothetical protein